MYIYDVQLCFMVLRICSFVVKGFMFLSNMGKWRSNMSSSRFCFYVLLLTMKWSGYSWGMLEESDDIGSECLGVPLVLEVYV